MLRMAALELIYRYLNNEASFASHETVCNLTKSDCLGQYLLVYAIALGGNIV